MKPILLAALLLAANGPPTDAAAPPALVAPAHFRLWSPREGAAEWQSAGVRIAMVPAPCTIPPNEACRFDGRNNQAQVTVSAPGMAPVRVLTDNRSSYYRIAVVQFDRRDARPGVVIENESGGSAGTVRVQLLVPIASVFRETWLPGTLHGQLPAPLRDLSGDGRVDFVLGDGRFGSAFGCNGCTPRPPVVLTLRNGVPTDVSGERPYAAIFRADMAEQRRVCLSTTRYRNGACAAYVADAARLGQFDAAWARMLPQYERDGDVWESARYRSFPESLRAFLHHTGYIEP